MLSKTLTSALVLLVSQLANGAPTSKASPAFEMVEAGALDVPNSIFSRLMPRSYSFHCSSGARVWAIRGSTAERGNNPMATFAHTIASWGSDSFASDLDYPALSNADLATYFADSVDVGIKMLTQRIQHYVDNCPGHKVALLGFSQGAQVLGDTLIGADSNTPGLDQKYLDALTAVVQFGDPAFTPGLSFDRGNPVATTGGSSYRDNYQLYTSTGLASKMISYCDQGDRYCSNQDGPDAIAIHDNEPQAHGDEAIAFVEGKLTQAGGTP